MQLFNNISHLCFTFNCMKYRYLLLLLISFCIVHIHSQTLVFAELTGNPVNTTGWNLNGATYIGDTGGDANTSSDEIILTDAINGSSGGIFYNQPIDLSTCYQWKVEFDFRMWEGSAADGIAFCFLDVPPTGFVSGGGVGIPAASNGVFVILDTYDNGCGANPEIQLFQGAGYDECGAGMINRITGLNFLRSSNYQTCLVEYASGTLTVSINGTPYLTGNYNANILGYMGFTASTGGATDKHSIKNVRIYADIATANAGADVTICSGGTAQLGTPNNPNYSYLWSGGPNLSSTTTSNPSVTLTNQTGSPITYTYNLQTTLSNNPTSCPDNDQVLITVNPVFTEAINASICQGSSYSFAGQTFSTAGIYPISFQTASGCDSTVVLTLDVNQIPTTELNQSICQGTSYSFGGQTLTAAGQYSQTLQTASGCDSIVNLNLTVNPTLSSTFNESICQGDIYPFFGQNLSASGIYSQTLQTSNGCDSIVNINLTVLPIPPAPTIQSNSPVLCPSDLLVMTASSFPNAQYFWSGPQNFSSTSQEISFAVEEIDMGEYSVYVIVDGCQSTPSYSSVSIINLNDFEDFEFPNVITANGDGINDSLDIVGHYKTCQEFNLFIYNRWGQLVFEQTIDSESFTGKDKSSSDLPDGVYFYRLNYSDKTKSGFIHLIR